MKNSQGRKKDKYWRDQITRWQQSGLSRIEYCRRENISYWSFRDWLKKVKSAESSKLVRVPRQAYPEKQMDDAPIEIVIQEKISIRIKRGYDGYLLKICWPISG